MSEMLLVVTPLMAFLAISLLVVWVFGEAKSGAVAHVMEKMLAHEE